MYDKRPGANSQMEDCETWDNAVLSCETSKFPMILETKRVAPGEMNTWYIEVHGTKLSAKFSTKQPKTLYTLPFTPGKAQAWNVEDIGYSSTYPAITGGIFEFGFSDAILQMWAAFCDEIVNGSNMTGSFRCAYPEEAAATHQVFSGALMSNAKQTRWQLA